MPPPFRLSLTARDLADARDALGRIAVVLGAPPAPWTRVAGDLSDAELEARAVAGSPAPHQAHYTRPRATLSERVQPDGNPRDGFSNRLSLALKLDAHAVSANAVLPVCVLTVEVSVAPDEFERITSELAVEWGGWDAVTNIRLALDRNPAAAKRWLGWALAAKDPDSRVQSGLAKLVTVLGDADPWSAVRLSPGSITAWRALDADPDLVERALSRLTPPKPREQTGEGWQRWVATDFPALSVDDLVANLIGDAHWARQLRQDGATLETWSAHLDDPFCPAARWRFGDESVWTWVWGPEPNDLLLFAARGGATAHRVEGTPQFRARVTEALAAAGGRWLPCPAGQIWAQPPRTEKRPVAPTAPAPDEPPPSCPKCAAPIMIETQTSFANEFDTEETTTRTRCTACEWTHTDYRW